MLKKTITYTDYDDRERTEDFYFNLTKAEVMEWLVQDGDYTLDQVVFRAAAKRNGKEVVETFKDLIRRSYGEKDLEGRRFMKSQEIYEKFAQTEAYSVLFNELVLDAKKAAEFLNAIIPKDLADELKQTMNDKNNIPEDLKKLIPSN